MNRIKSYFSDSVCYLVATPIGNLDDLSPRALSILNSVEVIACEDTRNTLNLLRHFNIKKELISYHEHNEQACSDKLIDLLQNGKSIAIVSDAGYPGISDPGAVMVKHCIENNIAVSIIPGGNAFLPALIGSGLDTSHFYFHGFLNAKSSQRKKELETLKAFPCTMIFYESPHRIDETLKDLYEVLGPRQVSISRELTKLHEEYIRGDLKEISEVDKETLIGEMVIVVEGATIKQDSYTDDELIAMVNKELSTGIPLKQACANISDITNIKKNYLYSLMIKK